MKKYLREAMANPEYRKAFEENEIFAMAVMAMTYEIQSEVEVVHFLCKHLKDLCEELKDANAGVIDTNTPNLKDKEIMEKHLKQFYDCYLCYLHDYVCDKQFEGR